MRWFQEAIDDASSGRDEQEIITALLLGVTPELRNLRRPSQMRLIAADTSKAMIDGIWRSESSDAGASWPVQGDWTALPLPDESCDLVFGDGCFVLLSGVGPGNLVKSIRRVLKPTGRLQLRVFIRPDQRETPQAVWDELLAGRIGNFHVFKFRLLASLSNSRSEVPVARAYSFFHERCPDPQALSARLGWPLHEIQTIDAYREQPSVYWYPTAGEFRQLMSTMFDWLRCQWPDYEMGDRCPSFTFAPLKR